jgi:hypothetical protein
MMSILKHHTRGAAALRLRVDPQGISLDTMGYRDQIVMGLLSLGQASKKNAATV